MHPGTVDFCVHIEPTCDKDPRILRAIQALQRILPPGSFNHVYIPILYPRPIVFSIKILRLSDFSDSVRIRTGIWIPANWEFLERLLKMRREAADGLTKWIRENADNLALDTTNIPTPTPKLLGFLPGVIV
jgi:hypothetical protein